MKKKSIENKSLSKFKIRKYISVSLDMEIFY